jgi:metallo-beta-lactamase class B
MTKQHVSLRCRRPRSLLAVTTATALALAAGVAIPTAQSPADAHVAAAKAAAGQEHLFMFNQLCQAPAPTAPQAPAPAAGAPPGAPDRSQWHVEPVKVFDNLYFVGQSEFSAWAVTTSAGIILVDTIFDYSVEDEVVGGLKKLGLDPTQIKYAIVSHGHGDHSGGANTSRITLGPGSSFPPPTGTCSIAAPARSRSGTWWPPTVRSSGSATRR